MVKQVEAESYHIMLGKFSKNTPEYAAKRKNEAAEHCAKVNITEGDYLVVNAGPFSKVDAEANQIELKENGLEGYIYTSEKEKTAEEPTEDPKQPEI